MYGTGWHAAIRGGVTAGSTVTVIGDGAVGLLAVLSAKQLGAERIVLMGRHQVRTDLGREYGVTDVVAERGEDGIAKVREITVGGSQIVLEAVGHMPAYQQAVGIVRPGGVISRVGVPQYEAAPVGFGSLFGHNITLTGGPAPVRAYIEQLLPAVLDGTVNPGKVFDLTVAWTTHRRATRPWTTAPHSRCWCSHDLGRRKGSRAEVEQRRRHAGPRVRCLPDAAGRDGRGRRERRWSPATGTSTPPRRTATSARSARRSVAPVSTARRSSSRPRSGSPTTATTRRCTPSTRAPASSAIDQIDLLILHQALPGEFELTIGAYRALEKLLADGKVRAIGVSNFMPDHLVAAAGGDLDRAGGQPDRGAPVLPPVGAARGGRRARASCPRRGRRSAASPSTATAPTAAPCRTR